MIRHTKTLGTLAGAVVAVVVASLLGGELATGVLAGFVAGAAVTLWGIEHQKRTARRAPERVWTAFGLAFLAKLGVLVAGTLALYLAPSLRERCDLRAFLVAFGFAAVLVLLSGTPEVARALQPTRPLDSRSTS